MTDWKRRITINHKEREGYAKGRKEKNPLRPFASLVTLRLKRMPLSGNECLQAGGEQAIGSQLAANNSELL
jgi:hypothetical protein